MRATIAPLALALLLAAPAAAGEQTLRNFHAGPYSGTAEQAALAFVAEHGVALVEDPTTLELEPVRTTTWHGRAMVHLQQRHRGVPVLGAGATVKVGRDGVVDFASLRVTPRLEVEVTASLPPEVAMAEALAAVAQAELATPPQLHVLAHTSGGRLVYRVPLFADFPPSSWMVTLDAHSGGVLDVSDLRLAAEGDVYPQSPAVGEVVSVTLTDLVGDESVMSGTYALVRSTVFEGEEAGLEHLATADPDGNFFFEPDFKSASEPFVEVHTYHHVTEVSHWLEDTHGHVFDGPAQVTTNFRGSPGGSFDNAYFTNGPQGEVLLVFGQGFVDFAYDADVVTHEFGHSIVQARTDILLDQLVIVDQYGWNMAPGALHEGIADYWAATRFDDPCMAEYVVSPCMRELDNDHTCPESLYGEVHYDGLIPGAAAWDIHELVGAEVADDLVYGALGLIGQTPTFQGMAEALSELAGDLVDDGTLSAADAEAIDAALDARGMFRCGRSLEVQPGTPLAFDVRHMLGFESFDHETCEFIRDLDIQFTAPFQFAVTIPADQPTPIDRVELTIGLQRLDGEPMGGDDLQYAMYVRRGQMVTLEIDALEIPYIGDFAIPRPLEYDLAFDGEPEIVAVRSDDMALEPGDTIYLSMIHMNCPGVTLTISSAIVRGQPPDDDDGCQCAAGDGPRVGPLAIVLLTLVAATGRRSRRYAP